VVGGLTDGLRTIFVEIKPSYLKDADTYREAATSLCLGHKPAIIAVTFFHPGDRIPASQTSKAFFDAGGWKNYKEAAMWWCSGGDSGTGYWSRWDCDRVGKEGAPLSAQCDQGYRRAFEAVLAIAGRAGTAEACGWPKNDDLKAARAYVARMVKTEERQQLSRYLEQMYSSTQKGPDNRADCNRLRGEIEEKAKKAKAALGL
jgi:hypothetical protein